MTVFGTDLNEDCPECLRLLRKNGVAEGWRLQCHNCPHGVIIAHDKRCFNEKDISLSHKVAGDKAQNNGVDKKSVQLVDRELE